MKRIISMLLVLSILLVGCGGSTTSAVTTDTPPEYWSNTNEFAKLIPIPNFSDGKVLTDSNTYYQVEVYDVSAKEYKAYVDAFYNAGFSNDELRYDTVYTGYITDTTIGRVDYYSEKSIMTIIVCVDEEHDG